MTPYERLRGRDFRGEIAECCEVAHVKLGREKTGKLDKRTSVGAFASDEHFLGTVQAISQSMQKHLEATRGKKVGIKVP